MILVTGGAGYIGSHTCVALLSAGYEVVIVDDFSNSDPIIIERLKDITKKDIICHEADVCDKHALEEIFARYTIDAVMHFAGSKAVGESVAKPLEYYQNNITGTLVLLDVMRQYGVKQLIFSSSATVYNPERNEVPFRETGETGGCTNPYGWTKYMIEQILVDLANADPTWGIALLRYFNPLGAHESGLIGDNPSGIPNNLMPYISRVATGQLEYLQVFGDDYDTPDGTGVRDYIHVVDLADGHIKALEYIEANKGAEAFNLGTGIGYSVLDIVKAFEKTTGIEIPYQIKERRPGDIASGYGAPDKALQELGWKTTRTLEDMCRDTYRFESNNQSKRS